MELVRDGWVVGPTDKSYKAYLSRPLAEDEQAARKAEWLQSFTAEEIRTVAEEGGKTPEQVTAELSESYEPPISGGHEAKFYYVHLSEEQQAEFIRLYNEKRMKIGTPGHFYVLPFFCKPATTQE